MISDEELNQVSMKIILRAGDARKQISDAVDRFIESDYQTAEVLLKQAEENLKNAHINQTKIIQTAASGEKVPYSILFSHAQDTLMTIMSEMNMTKKLMAAFRKLDER